MAIPIPLGFVAAMRASLGEGTGRRQWEWLIVARWGGAGQHLTIARTDVAAHSGEAAPIGLAPLATMLAMHVAPRSTEARFALLAAPPAGLMLAGRFLPASGAVALSCRAGRLLLRGTAHTSAAPWPAACHIRAACGDWPGQFVDA